MGHIFVISGPSRSGKNTITKELLKDRSLNLAQAVTCTTRPAREGEKNGMDYYFLSTSQFQEMINGDGFVEWAHVHDHLYGTSRQELSHILESGKNVLLVIDVQGAHNVKKSYPDATTIFIKPLHEDDLKNRMKKTGFSEKDIELRMQTAQQELAQEPYFDAVVVNAEGELARAVKNAKSIISETLLMLD